jgi:dihydrofolate synthase/folylpolyglutamate synthase
MNYRESIDWLFSTQMFGIKLGLDGPRRLLKHALAYPSHGVKVIHVAGTNGKGSTCAMVDSVARAAGVRTGLFTSPHLVDFRERIRVSGEEIPEESCADMLTDLRALCESLDPHPTFFEITLALGMQWFRERECELIVLETGMGGRLDATTAVPADVCAITSIGLDHTQWLGETLEAIAFEKAGIMVEGKPVICSPQEPGVCRVLEMQANERRSPIHFIQEPLRGYPQVMAGEHQAWNAALALECLHALGTRLSFETVQHGLSSVQWPGRFEVIQVEGKTVVLDGAHNPAAAKALAQTWRSRFGEKRPTLVFSAVATKDLEGLVAELEPLADQVHLCPVNSGRAVPGTELAKAFGNDCTVHASAGDAFRAALKGEGMVLVAGSLFLIGEIKSLLQGESWRPSEQ